MIRERPVTAAQARNADYLFIDTAGRLHTKHNLMQELQKVHRVIDKKFPGAPHETLLVLDGTIGQNAVQQAKVFAAEGREYRPELLMQPADVAEVVANALTLPRTAEVTDVHMRPLIKSY